MIFLSTFVQCCVKDVLDFRFFRIQPEPRLASLNLKLGNNLHQQKD